MRSHLTALGKMGKADRIDGMNRDQKCAEDYLKLEDSSKRERMEATAFGGQSLSSCIQLLIL
jgi:hypothetical protein